MDLMQESKPLVIFIGREVFKNAEVNCNMVIKPIGKDGFILEILPFKEGQSFSVGKHQKTDEGFFQELTTVYYENNIWIIKYEENSRDCDGASEFSSKTMSTGGYPHKADRAGRESFALEYNGIVIGSNQAMIDSNQRDIEAEKAGY